MWWRRAALALNGIGWIRTRSERRHLSYDAAPPSAITASLQQRPTETAAAEPSSFVAVTITPEPTVTEPPVVAPPAPLPAPAAPASIPGGLEVILPGGARLRLEGPVDPALAAAVVGALA